MRITKEDVLEAVSRETDLHTAIGENRNWLVALGRAAGATGAELARASGLSKTAVAEITVRSGRLAGEGLDLDEVAAVMGWVKNVALVAGGVVGYREYRTYGTYICQNRRFF